MRLARLMQGDIRVESELGKGSLFTVTLPLEGSRNVPGAPESKPGHLDIAESWPVQAFAGRGQQHQSCRHQVGAGQDRPESGYRQQRRRGRECAEAQPLDLILMDLAMPEMDGIEATRAIRSGQGVNRDTRIVAITANAFGEDRERCFAVGMNDFVTKPINIASFRSDITRWLGESPESETETEAGTPDGPFGPDR